MTHQLLHEIETLPYWLDEYSAYGALLIYILDPESGYMDLSTDEKIRVGELMQELIEGVCGE